MKMSLIFHWETIRWVTPMHIFDGSSIWNLIGYSHKLIINVNVENDKKEGSLFIIEQFFVDGANAEQVAWHCISFYLSGGEIAAEGLFIDEHLQHHSQCLAVLSDLASHPEKFLYAGDSNVVAVVYLCLFDPVGKIFNCYIEIKLLPNF
jgi:hypothetical protein